MKKHDAFASIVLYHNSEEQVKKVISSFFLTHLNVKLFLIDNSITNSLKNLASIDERIEYIFNNDNVGYGAGHNIAMRKSIEEKVPYHIVLNPDIYFGSGVIEKITAYMNDHEDIGHLMPKVLYPDGSLQLLCKLLPTPMNLFVRRFVPIKNIVERSNYNYELQCFDCEHTAEIPSLSGCFMFLRTEVLANDCLFDERFFMYLEDTDLTRRIGQKSKTVYFPETFIYHEYQKGAYKSKKLMWIFIQSVFTYFNKYGWFRDKERTQINHQALAKLECLNAKPAKRL
jgi:GT2 family glycosyltransferase